MTSPSEYARCKEASRWTEYGHRIHITGISARLSRQRHSSTTGQSIGKAKVGFPRGYWSAEHGGGAHLSHLSRGRPKLLYQIPPSGRRRCLPLQDCGVVVSLTSIPVGFKRRSICPSTPISTRMFRVGPVFDYILNVDTLSPLQQQSHCRRSPISLRFLLKHFHSKTLRCMERREYMQTAIRVGRI